MKVGSFATLDRVPAVHGAGGDFFELFSFNSFAMLPADEFDAFASQVAALPLPVGAFAGLVPGSMKLVGPDVDAANVEQYFATLFARIQRLASGPIAANPVVATLGSADARMVPEGYAYEAALDDFAQTIRMATKIAQDHNVSLTVEQLNTQECNFLTSLAEVGKFLHTYELAGTGITLDMYHMMIDGEPLSEVQNHSDRVRHVHIADTDRDGPGKGNYPFTEFLGELKKFNYSGNISIEAFWKDFDADISLGISTARSVASQVGFPV